MRMLSLSQLKDALTELGVSTATGSLRGEARRDELAKRLHHAKMANGKVENFAETRDKDLGEARKELEKLSLSELRSALELQEISTQTPGLKGEARRHALVQRLVNTCSSKQKQNGWTNEDGSEDSGSGRAGSTYEEEVDSTKSEASSSVYSTAAEFIFYDDVHTKASVVPDLQRKPKDLMPHLSLTKLQTEEGQPDGVDGVGSEECRKREQMERELLELRTKLHTSRQEQQQLVEKSLQDAGIVTSLGDISTKLQVLEYERRRLQDNYFGHELVTSDVLSSSEDNQIPLEFVQEDALVLIEKRQAALKQLAERTKEAMAVAKFHAAEMELGISKSARQEEEILLQKIRQVEHSLSATSAQSSSSLPKENKNKSELRSATSFRIQRDRVPIAIPETTRTSSSVIRVPTQADKLGMKARFMEKAKRNPDEIKRVYIKALELDNDHAENLGNYALFLCTKCEQFDEADNYFQQAIAADPINAKHLANYANFLMRQREQYTESEIYYKKALKIARRDVNIMGGYADLLTTTARGKNETLQQARRILKEALTLSPFHAQNQLRFALVLADLKEIELADRCFQELLDSVITQQNVDNESTPETRSRKDNETLAFIYEKYARFLHQCGHWERAKRMYDEALALDAQRPSLVRNFSFFLRESKPFLSPRIEPTSFRV